MSRPLFASISLLCCLQCDWSGQAPPQTPLAGSGGSGPQPTLLFVSSQRSFLDRELELNIVAIGTHFGETSRIDFGDSEISAVASARSASLLAANIHVGSSARIGWHDITVHTSDPVIRLDETVSLTRAFRVDAPLRVESLSPGRKLVAGGLAEFAATNLDYRETPFGTASMAILIGPRLVRLNGVSASRYSWLGILDAVEESGPILIQLRSTNPLGDEVRYQLDPSDGMTPSKEGRTAKTLVHGATIGGEALSEPLQSNLYRAQIAEPESALLLQFSNVGVGLRFSGPTLAWAPPTGRFLDGEVIPSPSPNGTTFSSLAFLSKDGAHYVSVFAPDYAGNASEYSYDLTTFSEPVSRVDLRELQPDSPTSPLSTVELSRSTLGMSGEIAPASDVDYLHVTTPRAGRVYVQAVGNPLLAVRIEPRQKDCQTAVSSARAFQNEFPAVAGSTYCLVLRSATATPYRLLIIPRWEP